MNHQELEDWAVRASQELQEFVDEAQVASGNPDGDDQLRGTRALIAELEAILDGRPTWQTKLALQESGNTELNI